MKSQIVKRQWRLRKYQEPIPSKENTMEKLAPSATPPSTTLADVTSVATAAGVSVSDLLIDTNILSSEEVKALCTE